MVFLKKDGFEKISSSASNNARGEDLEELSESEIRVRDGDNDYSNSDIIENESKWHSRFLTERPQTFFPLFPLLRMLLPFSPRCYRTCFSLLRIISELRIESES